MIQISDYGDNWSKWDPLFLEQVEKWLVPFELQKTICMIESSLGCDPRVSRGLECPTDIQGSKSEDGLSWGLMQMTLRTGRDYDMIVSPEKLNNPSYSIHIGSQHLARLCRIFQGQEEWIVKAYNQGEGKTIIEKTKGLQGNADQYWEKYQEHKCLIQS